MKWSEKASGFAACNFFTLILKQSEKTLITKKNLLSCMRFFVHMRQFDFDFYCFFEYQIFLTGFPIHS